MLAAGLESAFICNRCLVRIASRNHKLKSSSVTRLSKDYRRNASGTAVGQRLVHEISENDINNASTKMRDDDYEVLLKLHGKPVRHKRAQLGLPSLGKPAEIVIVDEEAEPSRGFWSINSDQHSQSKPASLNETIKETVDNVGRKLTREEINANIEALRASLAYDDVWISATQRDQLQQNLREGFSQPQLYEYIRGQYLDNPAEGKESETTSSILLSRTSTINRMRKAGKSTLINILINKLWNFQVKGEWKTVEIKLDSPKLALLSTNPSPQFRAMHRRSNLRIEYHVEKPAKVGKDLKGRRPIATLRVHGIADIMDRMESKLKQYISDIQIRDVQLPQVDDEVKPYFNKDLPQILAKRYGIHISKLSSSAWAVAFYPQDDRVFGNVIRDLYQSRRLPCQMENARLWGGQPSDLRLVDVECDESMHEVYRHRFKWQRWTNPNATTLTSPQASDIRTDLAPLKKASRFWNNTKSLDALTKNGDVKFEISAAFGQTLVKNMSDRPPESTSKSDIRRTPVMSKSAPIAFARDYPRLPQMLSTLSQKARSRHIELILSPKSQPIDTQIIFPEIHLAFSATEKDPDGGPQTIKMQAIFGQKPYDLLLPQNVLDIRLEHRLFYDLLQANEESVKSFVGTIREQLLADTNSIADVPGVVDICFPRILDGLIAEDTSSTIPDTAENGEPVDPSKTTQTPPSDSETSQPASNTISYLVSSPKLIDTVCFDYGGYPLSYLQYTDLTYKRQWKLLQLDSGLLSSRKTGNALMSSPTAVRKPVESFIEKALGVATSMGQA